MVICIIGNIYTCLFFIHNTVKMVPMVNHQRELRKELKKDLVAYLQETTVHGFRYIVDGRNLLEKLMWVLFIAAGFTFCGLIVYKALNDWDRNPVETTIDEVGVPVQELPFPAITVCDTKSLQMPRRNRWMFLETLLNSLELMTPKELINQMYPSMYNLYNSTLAKSVIYFIIPH